jgi:peptidase M28-like protein
MDWPGFEAEAHEAYRGRGRFPLRAYSEFMPAQFVGWKPCARGAGPAATLGDREIDEYEWAHEIAPGLDRIAERILHELGKLVRGQPHALSRTLLDGNPAWPRELADAAHRGKLAGEPLVIATALALSRTHDDKGNDRFTLFGVSHDGAGAALAGLDDAALDALVRWAGGTRWARLGAGEPPSLAGVDTLVTVRPFAELPERVRAAYLTRALRIVPTPASLVFAYHPRYRALAEALPRATQIPLLHLFPRCEDRYAIRIPQSGWLDEGGRAHRVVDRIARSRRWQRIARDAGIPADAYHDKVSTALFSTDPDVLGLYDKPLARNVQIWTADYRLLLDGPGADRDAIARAAREVGGGGRFGYRMYYPPMRCGARELFWHLPLVARAVGRSAGPSAERWTAAPLGYLTAEHPGAGSVRLAPQRLARPGHLVAAALPAQHGRPTPSHNARKLIDAHELLGAPLTPSFARSLLRLPRAETLDDYLTTAPAELRPCIGTPDDPGPPLVLDRLGTRAFEETIWRTIASLAEGAFRQKANSDGIAVNRGKTGGPAARAAHIHVAERRDLEALGDHLHAHYRARIAAHGMTGRAEVVDHVFRWETDFDLDWMDGWAKNQAAPHERNLVVMIPGKQRGEAVIMADHYDTAYMEDVYDADRGGDTLRAPALGADDNHSATTALMLAAEQLLPLAAAGKLERDVWLVHLTGEEFPADSLGARALCQGLVERHLVFTAEDGTPRDVSHVRVAGAFILDMIGHNTHRELDVFQIAPGEGAAAHRLAWRLQRANQRWNRAVAGWNAAPDRHGKGRARRMPDGSHPPPPFAHLALHGEVRVEWEPRSALYNTDGQVFSDLGVPVVLIMENYDISRTGYHDTLDTMANIDLDYCAAVTAIAIEAVVDTACAP